jgi:hypothetical protein
MRFTQQAGSMKIRCGEVVDFLGNLAAGAVLALCYAAVV